MDLLNLTTKGIAMAIHYFDDPEVLETDHFVERPVEVGTKFTFRMIGNQLKAAIQIPIAFA